MNNIISKLIIIIATLLIANTLHAASKYEIQKLIVELNGHGNACKIARERLIEIGTEAVPSLLREVEKCFDNSLESTRFVPKVIRVLKSINSPEAINICKKILLQYDPPFDRGHIGYANIVRNEALSCLYGLFNNSECRDLYVKIVTKRPDLYYFDNKQLLLDIFPGIPLLIKYHDDRVEDVLIHWIRNMKHELEGYFIIGVNGYRFRTAEQNTLWTATLDESGCAHEEVDFKMPYDNSPLITSMVLLKRFQSKKAIPFIEPLLKHHNDKVRETALSTLEYLTSVRTVPTGKTSLHKISLKNGDVLTGHVQNSSIKLKTPYAQLEFKSSEIAYIEIKRGVNDTDIIKLSNGDKLSGQLQNQEFLIKLKTGGNATIKNSGIESLAFSN